MKKCENGNCVMIYLRSGSVTPSESRGADTRNGID